MSDPDDELLGSLLIALYPASLSASEILAYLKEPKTPDGVAHFGRFHRFWRYHVPEKSTSSQLGELLDGLAERFEDFLPVLAGALPATTIEPLDRGRMPLSLLARFLATSQAAVSSRRLFNWLGVASDRRLVVLPEDENPIRDWLTSHPDVQKAIIATGVAKYAGSPDFRRCMQAVERRLFDAVRPADYADWCLERAVAAADREVAGYFMREVALSVHRHRHDEGLSREVVEERIGANAALREVLAERLADLEGYDAEDARFRQEDEALGEAWTRKRQRERRKWREAVEEQQAALREGRGDPALLEQLALAWFGAYVGLEGDTPRIGFDVSSARMNCPAAAIRSRSF